MKCSDGAFGRFVDLVPVHVLFGLGVVEQDKLDSGGSTL